MHFKIQSNPIIKAILLGNAVCLGKHAQSPRFFSLLSTSGLSFKLVSGDFTVLSMVGKSWHHWVLSSIGPPGFRMMSLVYWTCRCYRCCGHLLSWLGLPASKLAWLRGYKSSVSALFHCGSLVEAQTGALLQRSFVF